MEGNAAYEQHLEKARVALHALHLEQALEHYRAAEQLCADSYAAHVGLARTLTRMRAQDEAYREAEKAISLDPDAAEGYIVLGSLHFLTDRYDEAIPVLEKACALAPADPEPHLTLAQVHADLRRFEESRAALERGRALIAALQDEAQRESATALSLHVETYLLLSEGKTAEAIEIAQQVTAYKAINPYAACLAYSNLGILKARGRQYDEAIEYLEQAFQMNPFFDRAGGALGRLLILRNQHQRALEVLEEVVRRMPAGNGSTRYAYALALAKAGRRAEAAEQYRRALRDGLGGMHGLMARWQIIWLSSWGRYLVIGVILAAVAGWILWTQPSAQTLTFVALLALILILQKVFGRRKIT